VTTATVDVRRGFVALRTRTRDALARRWTRDILALLLSVLVTFFWFWRLILHIGNAVLYAPNDESYSIRLYWAAAHFGRTPWTLHRDILNGWPEGLGIPTAVEWANGLIPGVIWAFHYVIGITAAENVFLLGGFVVSAFTIYHLLDRFGLHPVASAYGAYAVTFSPWMFERAGAGHHGFMQLWVFVLQIWTLIWLRRRRSLLPAAAVGVALAVTFYDSPYYGLLDAVLVGVFLIVDFVQQETWHDRLWSFTLLDIAIVAAIVAYLPPLIAWAGDRAAVAAGVSNPIQEVQNGGASLASYAMPGTRNPFLGGITTHFYPRANFEWSENTLYLGWSLVALAFMGAWLVIRRHRVTRATPLRRYLLVSITILAPVAFIWSLKAKTSVFGLDVPTPSYLVGHITTFWRVYARFGTLVLLCFGILAALAIHLLVTLKRSWATALVVAAFAAILVEHAISIPTIYKLTPPPAWAQWLKQQPFGSVANYPLPTDKPEALTLLAESYFNQTYDKQPQFMLFGTGYGNTREDAIRILARYVTDPLTPGILKAEEVRYVLLHDDVYRAEGEQPPPVPAGMHLVATLPGQVRALELDPSVQPADLPTVLQQNATSIALVQGLPTPDVQLPQAVPSSGGSRIVNGQTSVELRWKGPNLAVVQLLLHAHTSGPPEVLELVDGNGKVVSQGLVNGGDTQLVLGPTGVDENAQNATFTLRAVGSRPVTVTSIQGQPVANVTKSIVATNG
jgi:hypothetical protein